MSYRIRVIWPADVAELVRLCQEHAAYEQADYDDNGQVERLQTALFGSKPVLECPVVESSQQLAGAFQSSRS